MKLKRLSNKGLDMHRAPAALKVRNLDFWPADSLLDWQTAPMNTFRAWLAEYRVVGRQLRPSAARTYCAIFALWVRFLAARNLVLMEATTADVIAFLEARNNRKGREGTLAPVTQRRYLQLLSNVYVHLRSSGWQGNNPVIPVLQKEDLLQNTLPAGLCDDALLRVMMHVSGIPGWKGMRDKAMLAAMAGAGLRANEVMNLRLEHLLPAFHLRVVPAGVHREHETIVLQDGPWREWLSAWLNHREQAQFPGELVFPATKKGEHFTPSGLWRRVVSWLEQAAVPQRGHLGEKLPGGPTVLRNCFAQQALGCGRYSLVEVQEFLGHEESRATARYATAQAF